MKVCKLLFIFLLSALASFAQFGMPSFKEVATHFFSQYDYDRNEGLLRFQRKKQGWYVSLDPYSEFGHYTHTVLFWAKDSGAFLSIDYPQGNNDTTGLSAKVEKYLEKIDWSYTEYAFEKVKYYGYAGWDWDIISEPSNEAMDNDRLLESRGRAYSNYAAGFVTEEYGDTFINNDSDRVVPKATDRLSKSRLDKIIDYDLKSIECYSRLQALNPRYETKVGNIAIKLANEYMFLYFWLEMAGNSVRAREYARKASYPDSLIKLSKNYLQALPKNSILITGGDNDTYAVWYLQVVEKFRPDVVVLNYSLLALRRYLLRIDGMYQHRLFTTKDTLYLQSNFDYSLYSNNGKGDTAQEMGLFLKVLRNNYNPFQDESMTDQYAGVRTYYAKRLFFAAPGSHRSKTFTLGDYLLINDHMLLDIIQTNPPGKIYATFNIELIANILDSNGVVFEVKK